MNLQPVNPLPIFFATCIACGRVKTSDKGIYADLDGESFKAYYCGDCARVQSRGE